MSCTLERLVSKGFRVYYVWHHEYVAIQNKPFARPIHRFAIYDLSSTCIYFLIGAHCGVLSLTKTSTGDKRTRVPCGGTNPGLLWIGPMPMCIARESGVLYPRMVHYFISDQTSKNVTVAQHSAGSKLRGLLSKNLLTHKVNRTDF